MDDLEPNLFMDKLPMAVVGGPALAGDSVTLVGKGGEFTRWSRCATLRRTQWLSSTIPHPKEGS